jgi:glycopeptide antibiotics resistance protein
VLTVLLIRSWVGVFSSKALLYMLFISSVQVISFSILLEGLQKLLTSTRQFSFDDIFANIAGTVFGAIIMLIFYNYLSPKSSQNQ